MDISERFAETLPCGCEFYTGQWFFCALHAGAELHRHHTRPVVGCLDCEDAMAEARALQAEAPWFDQERP